MPTFVLSTPVPVGTPGQAAWTDSSLIPGAGLTVQKAPVVASGVYTLTFAGAGVAVAVGPGANEATVTVGGGGGGGIGGTIAAGEVAFGTGVDTIGGDANFTYNGTQLIVATGGSTIDIGQGLITGGPNLTVETMPGGTLTLGTAGETVDIIGLNILVNGAPGAAGEVLTSNGPGVAPTWQAGGGGGGVPAPPLNSVQFNNAGAFGGSASLTFDAANQTLTLVGNAADTFVIQDAIGTFLTVNPVTKGLVVTETATGETTTILPTGLTALNPVTNQSGDVSGGFVTVTDNGTGDALALSIAAGTPTITSADVLANPFILTISASTTTFASGTAYVLASIGAAPLPAALRVNAVHVVANATVGPIVLPPMLPTDDGLRIEIANNVAGPMQVVPPAPGAGRAMSAGGGSAWVWVNALATWICTSNV
jgi:hypothetical protein